MSRSRDKLHIALLSFFLCLCISIIVFILVREDSTEREAVQNKMSEAGDRRMELIARTLEGTHVYVNDDAAFLVIYTDQDCGTCLNEMVNLVGRIAVEFESSIYAMNRSGERQFPMDNLVHLENSIEPESKLRNVPTPVLVYLDHTKEIKASFISTLSDDRNREAAFLDIVRKLTSG